MKITLPRNDLLQALQLVSGAVEKRQTLPILSHVLFHFDKKTLLITATDLEIELVAKLELTKAVEESFEITVPARKLIDICRSLSDDAILQLDFKSNRLNISTGKGSRSRFILSTLSAAEYPKVGKSDSLFSFTIPQSVFKYLLNKTYFAMAQQDVRYYLNGALFNVRKNLLRVVTTDGHRLALASYSGKFNVRDDLDIIVPRKGIMELLRLLNDEEDDVKVIIDTNHIHLVTPKFTFTSKLIDGKFPDFNRVIPKDTSKLITINRSSFKDSLSRVAILCNEKYHGIRLDLEPNGMAVYANNTDQEEAEEKLDIEYNGDKFDIGFNVNYLLDALASLPEGEVKLHMSDSNSSVLLEHADVKDCLYVVMPMRL